MSGTDDILPEDLRDGTDAALALDYALGVLGGDAMRAAELRLRRDPAFAADVASWQRQLAPMAETVAPSVPADQVWESLVLELFRAKPAAVSRPERSFWSSVAVWRNLTIGTSAIAALALAVLVTRVPGENIPAAPAAVTVPENNGRLLAASMASTDKSAAVVLTATYDPDRGQVILTPAAPENKRGLTPQLWIIVGKEAPKSLGMIDLSGAQALPIPNKMRTQLKDGATLAISLEPAGGSPTGLPTGPVVATGTLGAI